MRPILILIKKNQHVISAGLANAKLRMDYREISLRPDDNPIPGRNATPQVQSEYMMCRSGCQG